jgi:DNA-binding transcriptional LysR family regulator
MELSSTHLRVLRQIAESGSFTAAATHLGYTQSAISRQAASLERSAGTALFERRPDGVRLTTAGLTLLRYARTILDAVAEAEHALTEQAPRATTVRLGVFLSAGSALLPSALTQLAATSPHIQVTSREGTTPALARALRAGSLDLAVVTSRPPHRPLDDVAPRLHVETLDETELVVAAPATGAFAGRTTVRMPELADAPWIATPSSSAEPLLGVWPGLPGRPRIAHTARDWLTKLHLVASGFGVTTVPPHLARVMPRGVVLLRVEDSEPEIRRVLLARLPGRPGPAVTATAKAIAEVIHQAEEPRPRR